MPVFFVVPALVVIRPALSGSGYLGLSWGEVWGRLYVSRQVGRWLTGTPPGWADLCNAPWGRRFWPVDPLVQVVQVPLDALVGDALAWALVLALSSVLAGVGGYVAARVGGAAPGGALVVGLLLQISPVWLRGAAEGVTEVAALGPPALAAAAALAVATRPTTRRWLLFAGAASLTCGTSPYYAAYGVLALVLSLPLWGSRLRTALGLLAIGVLVSAVFAAPLWWAEAGETGRLSPSWVGGYGLVPEPLVVFDGDWVPAPPPALYHPPEPVGPLHALLVHWPGGIAASLALVLGMGARRGQRVCGFGLGWLLLGPGWAALARVVGHPEAVSPLQWVVRTLPGLELLGNDERLIVVPVIAAVVGVGPSLARLQWATPTVAIAAVLAALVECPPLSLPVVELSVPASLWPAVQGPTATWPDGDPPTWNPGQRPKGDLWLAGHHGGAQAYDYGRGGVPVDTPLLVRLSQVAGVPVAATAVRRHLPTPDREVWAPLREHGFQTVLLVYDTLGPVEKDKARTWMIGQLGEPVLEEAGGGVWRIR